MPFYRSIFFKLNLFFILALLILGLFFGLFRMTTSHMETRREMGRGMELGRLYYHTRSVTPEERRTELESAQFTALSEDELPENATEIFPPEDQIRLERHRLPFRMFAHEGTYYFRSLRTQSDLLIRDDRAPEDFTAVKILFALLLAGLAGLYFALRRSLLPLRTLHDRIRRFAQGELDIDTSSSRKDEIAAIANEFNAAVTQLRQLQASRGLFLRNIMHELKTPLTKGKLALAMFEDTEQYGYLDRLFNRMDELINRIALIERVQSIGPDRREQRLGDLIESAVNHLYLTQPRSELLHIGLDSDASVQVDTPLFESALTNLLDNAIKYADTLPVMVTADGNALCIINTGRPLPSDITSLLQPFSGGEGSDGLGLGLFIADTVIRAHGFGLKYSYTDGQHRFCIDFTAPTNPAKTPEGSPG